VNATCSFELREIKAQSIARSGEKSARARGSSSTHQRRCRGQLCHQRHDEPEIAIPARLRDLPEPRDSRAGLPDRRPLSGMACMLTGGGPFIGHVQAGNQRVHAHLELCGLASRDIGDRRVRRAHRFCALYSLRRKDACGHRHLPSCGPAPARAANISEDDRSLDRLLERSGRPTHGRLTARRYMPRARSCRPRRRSPAARRRTPPRRRPAAPTRRLPSSRSR
jgi:hypothetical protein